MARRWPVGMAPPREPPPPVRYGMGSTGRPFSRASRCRCGPVTLPVAPTRPICWPCATRARRVVRIADMCAYSDDRPPPWLIWTCWPYGPPVATCETVPAATARTGVPVAAGKSRPVCRPEDHMRPATPNLVPYPVLTGLTHWPPLMLCSSWPRRNDRMPPATFFGTARTTLPSPVSAPGMRERAPSTTFIPALKKGSSAPAATCPAALRTSLPRSASQPAPDLMPPQMEPRMPPSSMSCVPAAACSASARPR